MTRLVVSPEATADFSDILDRLTELAGVSVAERYTRDLRSIYQRLARFPENRISSTKAGIFNSNHRLAALLGSL